jgi:hypothetical protein
MQLLQLYLAQTRLMRLLLNRMKDHRKLVFNRVELALLSMRMMKMMISHRPLARGRLRCKVVEV